MARPQAPVGAPAPKAVSGDHRARLEALRDLLTEALPEAGAREKAALAGQLRATLVEIAALPDPVEAGDVVDALAARRARSAATPRSQRPAASS